jgi:hypothetical protein
MNTHDIAATLATLLGELVDGPSGKAAYMLNRGDAGLLRSLGTLTARQASATSHGGASIAAHVDHVRYGLSLMNRWTPDHNPFATADWAASWRIGEVSDAEWQRLRDELRQEARRWIEALGRARDVKRVELNGMVGSIAHVAYHLGAIRQIDARTRGPAESQPAAS